MPSEYNLVINQVTHRLARKHDQRVPYQRVWRAIAEGLVDAEKINGRWAIRERDEPVLAKALGLTEVTKP